MAVVRGALVPAVPPASTEAFTWTLSLLGGVGGTVTLLCYGYWIRQQGRTGSEWLTTCRVDLAVGYLVTGLFGVAMLLIASGADVSGRGANLIVELAARLEDPLGSWARWVFLLGAWAAVVSSLLGVWQALPMLFADAVRGVLRRPCIDADALSRTVSARVFLILMATLPILQAWQSFRQAQKVYAVMGAFFLPLLAIALLWLNRRSVMGLPQAANGPLAKVLLLATLAIFLTYGWFKLR
jgi:Mn2+/Fe2+ NRAMP family transporter